MCENTGFVRFSGIHPTVGFSSDLLTPIWVDRVPYNAPRRPQNTAQRPHGATQHPHSAPTAFPQRPHTPHSCPTAAPQRLHIVPTALRCALTALPQRSHSIPQRTTEAPASPTAPAQHPYKSTAPLQRARKASNLSIQRPPDAQQQCIPLCVLRLSALSTVCVSSLFADHSLQALPKTCVFVWRSHPLERWLYCKGLQPVSLALSLDETL